MRSLYCCSDGVRGRGAPMTYLSHTASFHSNERIAPSNRGIKHLEVCGISKSEVYRRIKDGTFPRSHAFKCNARRFWMSHEIKAWQQSQLDHEVPELKYGIPQDDFEALLDPC